MRNSLHIPIASLLIAAVIAGGLLLAPPRARAGIPVFEDNPLMLLTNKVTALSTAKDVAQTLYEWAQTFVLTHLKRQLLDRLVDQVVKYVQGGGTPRFVTNWEDFLRNSADAAAGGFLNELAGANLCAPFGNRLNAFFGAGGGLINTARFRNRAQCTLSDIVANIEEFYQDFSKGGWEGYAALWEPQNNIYGSYLMGITELTDRAWLAQEAALNEAIAGRGFLGDKDSRGNIKTPGATIAGLVEKAAGADFDFIVNAQQLGDYTEAIANALIFRLTSELSGSGDSAGLGEASGSGDAWRSRERDDAGGRNRYNDYLTGRIPADAASINEQNFRRYTKALIDDIDEAIRLRTQAQAFLDQMLREASAGATITLVLAQKRQEIENWRSVLLDVYAKFAALTQDQLSGLCFSDRPKTVARVRNRLLPKIQDDVDAASAAVAAIDLALGGDATNQGLIDRMNEYRAELAELANTAEGRARLSEIYTSLGSGFVIDAQTLKDGIKNIGKTMDSLSDAVCTDNGTPAPNATPPDGWVPRYNVCVRNAFSNLRMATPSQCAIDAAE